MRKTLESFFHGNIKPSENQMAPNSDLLRAVDKAARCEKRLTEQLGEPDKAILTELSQAQHEIFYLLQSLRSEYSTDTNRMG